VADWTYVGTRYEAWKDVLDDHHEEFGCDSWGIDEWREIGWCYYTCSACGEGLQLCLSW